MHLQLNISNAYIFFIRLMFYIFFLNIQINVENFNDTFKYD